MHDRVGVGAVDDGWWGRLRRPSLGYPRRTYS